MTPLTPLTAMTAMTAMTPTAAGPSELLHLAPLAILGLWSLLLVATARVDRGRVGRLPELIALSGVALALAAALSLLGTPGLDAGIAVAGATLLVDPLAALLDVALLITLGLALLLRPPAQGPSSTPLAFVAAAGCMLTIHAADLLPLIAGLEIAGLALCGLFSADAETDRAPGRPGSRGDLARRWLVGQGILSALLLFGVALVVAATGTTSLSEIGGRAAMIYTRWGAGPAQAATDLLLSEIPIPEALATQARSRAVTAMAPVALFLPGMLLTLGALALRFGAFGGHRLLGLAYEHASPRALLLVEGGLRLAALAALLRLFVTGLHVPRQLFAPYGWSTPAALLIALTLGVGAVIALRGRELRRWLAGQSLVAGGWLLLGALSAATFYGHAGLRGGAVTVIDNHAWGLASGYAAVAALLGLALTQLLGTAGLLAVVAAAGDPVARGPLALRGLAARRPALAVAAAILLVAVIGAPPSAIFRGRLELLSAVIADTNLPSRLLLGLALLAASAVAAGALRHLLALFDRPTTAEETPPTPPQAARSAALVYLLTAATVAAALTPDPRHLAIELAGATSAYGPGHRKRLERAAALRERWQTPEGETQAPHDGTTEDAAIGPSPPDNPDTTPEQTRVDPSKTE